MDGSESVCSQKVMSNQKPSVSATRFGGEVVPGYSASRSSWMNRYPHLHTLHVNTSLPTSFSTSLRGALCLSAKVALKLRSAARYDVRLSYGKRNSWFAASIVMPKASICCRGASLPTYFGRVELQTQLCAFLIHERVRSDEVFVRLGDDDIVVDVYEN